MTTSELMQAIGKTGLLTSSDGLYVSVRITDARGPNWGRIDYLVTPICGQGSIWIDSKRVTLDNTEAQ